MDPSDLNRMQHEEEERANSQGSRARAHFADRGLSWALKEIYADKIRLPSNHAYHQSGSLCSTASLNERTILEVFPYPDQRAFQRAVGLSVGEVEVLAKQGIIDVLIRSYPNYAGLDYLDPILSLQPACYQERGFALLEAIAPGRFREYVRSAREREHLTGVFPSKYVGEPYEQGGTLPTEKLVEKTLWRYAALCCFLGQDIMDDIVNTGRERAPNYVNELHTIFLHPISHGMFGDPFNSVSSFISMHHAEHVEILDSIERVVCHDLHLDIRTQASFAEVLEFHNAGISAAFTAVRASLFREVARRVADGDLTVDQAKAQIMARVADLRESANRIVYDRRTRRSTVLAPVLTLGLIAGGIACVAGGLPTLSTVFFGASAAPFLVKELAHRYAAWFDPMVSHYVELVSTADRK